MSEDTERKAMKEVVGWLAKMEQLACETYRNAASVMLEDKDFAGFLSRLADDERDHAELMNRIQELTEGLQDAPPSDIRLDAETEDRLSAPLMQFREDLSRGSVSRKQVAEYVARIEFSEWNDLFLYVIGRFRSRSRETEQMTAAVQDHKQRIESFLGSLPPDLKPSLDVGELPEVWERRILLVDDSEIVRDLEAGLLREMGQVTVAGNGKQALEATRRHFFDAIVSDLQMPVMDGVDFYRAAVAEHPALAARIMFLSLHPTAGQARFLQENGLSLLLKPFGPEELRAAVRDILARDAGGPAPSARAPGA